jgi:uncharacterized heparinase superfamily protein
MPNLYYHTLKYLKAEQIAFRILKKFKHPQVHQLFLDKRYAEGDWITIPLYQPKFLDKENVCFLNHNGVVKNQMDWNNNSQEKLWLYNLHYFDDLNSLGSGSLDSKKELQIFWVERWVRDNPAPTGNGWEPYPISLRVVNWVKAFISGLKTEKFVLDSLCQQVDYLSQDLERHLLGNHLFVNAKALIFAGCFFEGDVANKWLKTGLSIFIKELNEQVLADGGNYELTPMYHVIMLVDLLDLINLFNTYPDRVSVSVLDETRSIAIKMLVWLDRMSHLDNGISFFNDATFGIAPENDVVFNYAKTLGLVWQSDSLESLQVHDLKNTGYVSVKNSEFSLICDLANVGPDYQPGHAHADTLSFEWCLGANRVLVNSGISEYGVSAERLRQRKLSAHNTVSINGLDSSEVWSGFRVARRAKIIKRDVSVFDDNIQFSAAHDGFKKLGVNCEHERSWSVTQSSINIVDTLAGKFDTAISFLHLHPDVQVLKISKNVITLITDEYTVNVKVEGAGISIEDTTWHPEFGKVIPNKKITLMFNKNIMKSTITWSKNS